MLILLRSAAPRFVGSSAIGLPFHAAPGSENPVPVGLFQIRNRRNDPSMLQGASDPSAQLPCDVIRTPRASRGLNPSAQSSCVAGATSAIDASTFTRTG